MNTLLESPPPPRRLDTLEGDKKEEEDIDEQEVRRLSHEPLIKGREKRKKSSYDVEESRSSILDESGKKSADINTDEYIREQLRKRDDIFREDEGKIEEGTLAGRFRRKLGANSRFFLAVTSRKLLLRQRSLVTTIVEVFLPPLIILTIVAAFLNGVSWDKAHNEQRLYGKKSMRFGDIKPKAMKNYFREKYCDTNGRILLLYYPDTKLVRNILTKLLEEFDIEKRNKFHDQIHIKCDNSSFSCGERMGLIAMKSPEHLLETAVFHRTDSYKHSSPIGVLFEYDGSEKDDFLVTPTVFKYTIRLFDTSISETRQKYPYVFPPRTNTKVSPYVKSGFMGLQFAIEDAYLSTVDEAIMREFVKNETAKNILFNMSQEWAAVFNQEKEFVGWKEEAWPMRVYKMYNYSNFFTPKLNILVTNVLCFTMLISYAFFTYFIVKQVVLENEVGIKHLLSLHYFPLVFHWINLGLHILVLRFVTAALVTIVLYQSYGNGKIVGVSSLSLVFPFLYVHMVSLSSFNFFLASHFTNVELSGLYAIGINLFTCLIPMGLERIGLVTFWPNLGFAILFPNWAFLNGLKHIIFSELEDKELSWKRFLAPLPPNLLLTIYWSIIIMAVSGLIYFSMAVFRDLTHQKSLTPRPKWYKVYKLMKEIHKQRKVHKRVSDASKAKRMLQDEEIPDIYERPGPDFPHRCIVQMRNLSITKGQHNVILDNISLDIYQGEITVFVGPAGSGKSFLIHAIAGMITPDNGYVLVHGLDVINDKRKTSHVIGYSPQADILFNLLSVQEHLHLCYRIRGLSLSDSKVHVDRLLSLMRLDEVRKKMPSELSPLNKKKLSLSLALVNAPRVILLDNPTLGLDPGSRREIWNILVEIRQHHSVVIATSRMDEAESLADRLGLLAHAKLICYGTPRFLKSKYETGYFLKLYPMEGKELRDLDAEKIMETLGRSIDGELKVCKNKQISGYGNVTLRLPYNSSLRYAALFDELEDKKSGLNVGYYSMIRFGLCDIFIKISDAVILEGEAPDKYYRHKAPELMRTNFEGYEFPEIIRHKKSAVSELTSAFVLLRKRFILMKSKTDKIWVEYVLPLVLVFVICYHIYVFVNPMHDTPPMELSLNTYRNAKVFYRIGATDTRVVLNRDFKGKVSEVLGSAGNELKKTEQVLKKLEEANRNGYAREKYMVAMEARQVGVGGLLQLYGYHASSALHAPPVIMNIISNIILSAMFPLEKESDRKIIGRSHPFPTQLVVEWEQGCGTPCIIFAGLTSLALSLYVGGIIICPKIEKTTGMKHLQTMAGLPPIVYWAAHFIWDVLIGGVMVLLIAIAFSFVAPPPFFPRFHGGLPSLLIIMSLYLCWSTIPLVYSFSTLLPDGMGGYGAYFLFHIVAGCIPASVLERELDPMKMSTFTLVLRAFFNIFPMYTITAALHRWISIKTTGYACGQMSPSIQSICQDNPLSPAEADLHFNLFNFMLKSDKEFAQCCDRVCKAGSLASENLCYVTPPFVKADAFILNASELFHFMVILTFQGFFYWGALILFEKRIMTFATHRAILRFIKTYSLNLEVKYPGDVEEERAKCEELMKNEMMDPKVKLICHNLTKSEATAMVVNDLSIAVEEGECVGILGGCGSGKTAIVKLLCGITLATAGEIKVGNYSIHDHRKAYLSRIGYCPQHYCFFDNFTLEQMLEFMGRLRGITPKHIKKHVDLWINIFEMEEERHDPCKKLKAGVKRALGVAMSLIGGNEIIVIDEPTKGIDGISRFKLWKVMKMLAIRGFTIVFTTASTEECDLLSTRMAVFGEGNIQCIGPPKEIEYKIGRGYVILIRIRVEKLTQMELVSNTEGRVVALKSSMRQSFRYLQLRDMQDNMLLYFLRDWTITWGSVFKIMHAVWEKNENIIEKYYVSETTVDDIYIRLTNKYRELDNSRRMEPISTYSLIERSQLK